MTFKIDSGFCSLGGFRVTGKICTQCSLSDPISGELTVEASAVPILSIDIHLLRVESTLLGERIITETSLIQTTQAILVLLCYVLFLFPFFLYFDRVFPSLIR